MEWIKLLTLEIKLQLITFSLRTALENKLLQRELIKKEVINSIDVNIMHFFHPSGL